MAEALPLQERVRETIRTDRLLARGNRVLLGVSGGPDSVALLHLLWRLREAWRLGLAVVHVDHQLRPESGGDAAFVEAFAGQLGVPVTVVRRDLGSEPGHGLSLEDHARRIRYAAFQEVAARQRATHLALAHTADDQAETVLMRLLRGSGLAGAAGIPVTRPLGEVTIIRPLLRVWRQEILAYLREHRLSSRQDATNADRRFVRNRIRHELIPLLEREYNPQIKVLLTQFAQLCQADAAFLSELARRSWKRLVKPHNGALAIRCEGLIGQPKALQRQLIRLAIQSLQGDLAGFEFRHWLQIERLVTDRPAGTILDLPGQVRLERTREHVLVGLR